MHKTAGLTVPKTRRDKSKRQEKLQKLLEKGMRLQSQGNIETAIQYYNKILRIDPSNTDALFMRAQVHIQRGEHEKAIEIIERCIKSKPGNANLRYILGFNYFNMSRRFEAIRHLECALKLDPDYHMARLLLAKIYADAGRIREGRRCLAQGSGLHFEDPDDRLTHYHVLLGLGYYHEAKEILARLIKEGQKLPESFFELTRLPGVNWKPSNTSLVDKLLANKRVSASDGVLLHFAAGRIADSEGEYCKAISHFIEANRLTGLSFDIAGYRETVARLCRLFQPDFFDTRREYGLPSTRPVFIVGLPRSGKSLVENSLSLHSKIGRVGEMTMAKIIEGEYFIRLDGILPDSYEEVVNNLDANRSRKRAETYLNELQKYDSKSVLVTNSLPHNFQNIAIIKLLFPNASIIHIKRNPVDTCLFCFMKNFAHQHSYSNDLSILGHYYNIYHELMEHWQRILPGQIHQISYEQFVTKPKATLKELEKFLGVEVEQGSTEKPLKTSLGSFSTGDAPGPINTSYISYWRNYEQHLAPLLESLGDLAPPSGSST